MKIRKIVSAFCLLMALAPTGIIAEQRADVEHPYYATLGAGYMFLEGDEEVLDQQVYEARLGYRVNPRWSLETGFGIMPDVRAREYPSSGMYKLDGDTSGFRFIADALYHLDEDAYNQQIDPYLAFGVGLAHYNKELEDGHTDLLLSSGVGAFVALNDRWFVKPDYRIAMVGHDTEVNHHALISLGYRWGGKKNVNSSNTDSPPAVKLIHEAGLQTIYFAFDSSNLTNKMKSNLQHNADWIKKHPGRVVTIEGYCDERGTLEYNLALGSRRARSVYEYLKTLGISLELLKTVSYGEDYPADLRSTEAGWEKNRRAEFTLDGEGTLK